MHCCKICNKEIPKRRFDSVKKYLTRIVCSRACYKSYSNTPEMKEFYKQNRAKSKGQLGRVWTDEERKAHSVALTGRKFSDEARKNISFGHIGEKSSSWKGGVSSLSRFIRTNVLYFEWRNKVYKRDGYKCVVCDSKKKLHADHIKPLCDIINPLVNIFGKEEFKKLSYVSQSIYDVSNGRLLCEECHKKTPSWGSREGQNIDMIKNLTFTVA